MLLDRARCHGRVVRNTTRTTDAHDRTDTVRCNDCSCRSGARTRFRKQAREQIPGLPEHRQLRALAEDFKKDAIAQGISPQIVAAASPRLHVRSRGDQARPQPERVLAPSSILRPHDPASPVQNGQMKIRSTSHCSPRSNATRRAAASADRVLGSGKRLRRQLRQVQHLSFAGDAGLRLPPRRLLPRRN